MDNRTKNKISGILIFLFFIIFPFGQLLRWDIHLWQFQVPIILIDLLAGACGFIYLLGKRKFPSVSRYFFSFLALAVFSQLLFIGQYGLRSSLLGIFYLFRLFIYLGLFLSVWAYLAKDKLKAGIYNYLIASAFFVAVFGWLQYFFYPDLRNFIVWGWDDHLFRLVGTFLDPTFTGIILVFGILASLAKFQEKKDKKLFLLIFVMLSALAFTYSRAGYLALVAGLLTYLALMKRVKISFLLIPIFFMVVFLLPRPSSEGVHLERTRSISLRIINYKETLQIALKSPVFGVGFNNLCWARVNYLGGEKTDSHSCSGSDSSLLLILATMGISGVILFINLLIGIFKSVNLDFYGNTFLACLAGLLVHSFFSNSLFYPWVMGFLMVFYALALKTKA